MELGTGIHYGVPELAYRQLDAINASVLKKMRQSPLHAHEAITNPTPPTAAMTLGSAVHLALLEPERFALEHAVGPTNDKRTAKWKDWAAAQTAPLLLTGDEAVTVQKIRESVDMRMSHTAYDLLRKARGRSEVTAVWRDPDVNALCKARADRVCVPVEDPVVVELKTTRDASRAAFMRSIREYGYDIAAAWYARGIEIASNRPIRSVFFIAVETVAPYGIACYRLTDDWMATAEAEAIIHAQRFVECRTSGDWPGYADEVQVLEPWRNA